jgi:hexosaminidase
MQWTMKFTFRMPVKTNHLYAFPQKEAQKVHLLSWIVFFLLASRSFCAIALPSNPHPALLPEPREFEAREALSLKNGAHIFAPNADTDDRFAAQDLAEFLRARNVKTNSASAGVRIYLLRDTSVAASRVLTQAKMVFDPAMKDEGYVLFTTPRAIYIVGHTAAGVFYGAQTAKQLVSDSGRSAMFYGCAIRDWPAMRYRGVHDDLSRGPLPTLEFQKKQIRTFAAYKMNVYSPYFENTMQYDSNPLPGLPGGSISKADAEALVEYAKQYHVTIVPEQEAFGHLHHVLTWQKYAHLAEVPSGSVLAPGDPGSLQVIGQWFTELAAIYPAPFLHIGADETAELGRGRTADEVKQRGLGAVYIDFLTRIHAELAPLHRRLLFWGDMAMNDPALVPNLPKDMIAVAWHYEPEPNGFSKWLDPYTKAGLETWVAPGVNNWKRVYPNNDAALRNIQGFVADGQKAGSTGMLNTIWNDDGEGLFAQDWYGILFGAAAAWQPGTSDIAAYQKIYGEVFHGDKTGDLDQAQIALIAAHLALQRTGVSDGQNALFWLDPWSVEGQQKAAKLQPVLEEVRLDAEQALTLIAEARHNGDLREVEAVDAMELGARRMDFLAFQFQVAGEMADKYQQLYQKRNDAEASKHLASGLASLNHTGDLRDGYGYLRDLFSDAWLKENRPYWLDNVTAEYDAAMQLWIGRGIKLRAAQHEWGVSHTLPSPESIGIAPISSSN